MLGDKARWLEVTGVSAGLHVTALLHDREEADVIEQAARRSVALLGIADHSIAAQHARDSSSGTADHRRTPFLMRSKRLTAILDTY